MADNGKKRGSKKTTKRSGGGGLLRPNYPRRKFNPVRSAKRKAKRAAKKAAYRAGKKIMSKADATVRAIFGGRRAKETTPYRKLRDLIKAYGEEGARQRVGVTKKTWKAWTTPDRKARTAPSAASRRKIDTQHDTEAVRQATMPKRRVKEMTQNGLDMTIIGMLGPRDSKYQRFREISAKLPPEAAERVMMAFREGGAAAAHEAAMSAIAEHYMDPPGEPKDWTMYADEITEFTLTPREGPWETPDYGD